MEYFWLFSLLAPICLGASNLVDNHVLHARLSDPVAYDIVTAWSTVPIAVCIFLEWRVSFAFDAWFVGTAVGFAFAFLFILYNIAMMREQGTNVVSVIYTSPLFIAVLALVFLGEKLSVTNYMGILLLVSSAFLVLYRRIDAKNIALGIILVYAFASSVSRVVTKSALEDVDVWSYFFWFLVGGIMGTTILAALRPRSLSLVLRTLDARLLLLIIATTAFSTLGLVFLYSAFSLGSVALASGLSAIQPTVVFVYSTVLLRIRPGAIPAERITGRWADARKIGAVLLIVLGAAALTGL
ncbi:MAG TPA: EamA family transporter [Nitrososphaerales archaeon]|nr:EamA family transporter [Nitrososphaerales archaeon]